MRVICTQLRDANRQPVESSPWLTIGRTYTVLGVEAHSGRKPLFRIVGDDGRTPGVYEADMFEVASAELGETWICAITQDGGVQIGPAPWLRERFWEDYFNGEPGAVRAFDQEFKVLLAGSD